MFRAICPPFSRSVDADANVEEDGLEAVWGRARAIIRLWREFQRYLGSWKTTFTFEPLMGTAVALNVQAGTRAVGANYVHGG